MTSQRFSAKQHLYIFFAATTVGMPTTHEAVMNIVSKSDPTIPEDTRRTSEEHWKNDAPCSDHYLAASGDCLSVCPNLPDRQLAGSPGSLDN